MTTCTHVDTITVTELPESVVGCEDCLRAGDLWLHLRICLECGHVGCCDDSPNRHALRLLRVSRSSGLINPPETAPSRAMRRWPLSLSCTIGSIDACESLPVGLLR